MTNECLELQVLLQRLVIPPDISRLEGIQESPSIEQWKETLSSTLSEVLALLRVEEATLGMDEKANLVFIILPFIPSELWLHSRRDGPSIPLDDWSTAGSFSIAQGKSDSLFPFEFSADTM